MQGAVKRATHRVDTVHPLDRLLDLFWRHQANATWIRRITNTPSSASTSPVTSGVSRYDNGCVARTCEPSSSPPLQQRKFAASVLFVLDALRRSSAVERQDLHLPFYRHRRWRIANGPVARLITQLAAKCERLALAAQ